MRILIATFIIALLTSCSSTYQPEGFSGGFTETALRSDYYKVTFAGNGFTSPDKTNDLAVLRAAELALKAGYNHMIITSSDNRIMSTGGNTYVPQPYNDSSFGKGFAQGAAAVNSIKINKPTTTVYVRFINASEQVIENNPEILNAEFIVTTIKKKHNIE